MKGIEQNVSEALAHCSHGRAGFSCEGEHRTGCGSHFECSASRPAVLEEVPVEETVSVEQTISNEGIPYESGTDLTLKIGVPH
ncbi:MAG: hypothetical protein ABIK07_16415, partial [Planctomycetota bacterium]